MNKIIMAKGALGSFRGESDLDTLLRAIAVQYSKDSDEEWAEKYGTNFENDKFAMRRFCWCEDENCGVCNGSIPNFEYKPLDFTVSWYKYIGRGVECNKEFTEEMYNQIVKDIL